MQTVPTTERRVFGPPGCGKTEYIRRQAKRAIEDGGYQPRELLFSSFTRAAAYELASRGMPVDERGQIGTLHAICYRAHDRPEIAESYISKSSKTITAFNDWCEPAFRLAVEVSDPRDELTGEPQTKNEADKAYSTMQRLRSRQEPRNIWPEAVLQFEERWSHWKRLHGVMDFNDLIETAIDRFETPPTGALVGFFDEVQDMSATQMALIRQWGEHMDYLILAGDPNQAIYSFAGAEPKAFLYPDVPDDRKHRLRRSYRCPKVVIDNITRWINQATTKEVFDFEARDGVEGELRSTPVTYRMPDQAFADMQKYLDEGKSVMYLTSASYMLDPMKAYLRSEGIPFHNPYRKRRGDWNPLNPAHGVSTAERLHKYLTTDVTEFGRLWKVENIVLWMEHVGKNKIFRKGAKEFLAGRDRDSYLDYWYSMDVFTDEAIGQIFEPDGSLRNPSIDWFAEHIIPSKQGQYEYPVRVARRGIRLLSDTPQIILGTCHSVKGGEADCVYLAPDLSPAAFREWNSYGEPRDSVLRVFYVGMSRARESLIIMNSATSLSVNGLIQ